MRLDSLEVATQLKSGKIGVIPTDTIYGMVGLALSKDTVEKIYKVKKRGPKKPMIILICSIDDLKKFNIELDKVTKQILEKIWPNPVSVILACPESGFKYLHRGTNTLAFRMPKDDFLLELLGHTGSLVAPSANFEGEIPATTINEAKKYFGNTVDFYLDGGSLESKPSTLIEIKEGKICILRQGLWKNSLSTLT